MAGDWIKVETATPNKPEVMKLARILGIDRDAAFGKLFRLWAWFDANSVDGSVDGAASTDVDVICLQPGFADACEQVGWLQIDSEHGKVTLPNFSRHNGQTAKNRVVKAERQRKWRENVDASVDALVDAHTSTRASTREEKRRDNTLAPAPADALVLESQPAKPTKPAKRPRQRNELLDTLAAIDGQDPEQVTPKAWPGFARALSEIRAVTPGVTPDELKARARNYRTKHPEWPLTAQALAKRWGECASFSYSPNLQSEPAVDEPKGWREYIDRTYPGSTYSSTGNRPNAPWSAIEPEYRRKFAAEITEEGTQ